jgi:hypothetical protein
VKGECKNCELVSRLAMHIAAMLPDRIITSVPMMVKLPAALRVV